MGRAVLATGGVVILVYLVLALLALGLTVYGLCLAFSASIVLGIIALIVEPSPLVIALVYLAFGYNIPEKLLQLFNS